MAVRELTWFNLALGPRQASLELAHRNWHTVPVRAVVQAAGESHEKMAGEGKRGD